MKSPSSDPRLAQFPPALCQLLSAELESGNEIVEVASCFPAPPAGAYVKLAKPITTRAPITTAELSYYDRNTSLYSGEWTDAKRFYFLLEPPRPPKPEPDMNAIREASNAPQAGEKGRASRSRVPRGVRADVAPLFSTREPAPASAPPSLVERFRASMMIDYEKWHDGIGYDLELLKSATPGELNAIETLVLARGAADWRDVEALAVLNTTRAKKALQRAMDTGNTEIRGAIMRHAPRLVCEEDKTTFLVEALRTAEFYGGLSQALAQVADYHPAEVIKELLRGTLERSGAVAVHFAAMLMFVHGKSAEPFDWAHRPFFLRFGTPTRATREAVFRELCEKLGVDADKYLKTSD